jgi:hypothetical protein
VHVVRRSGGGARQGQAPEGGDAHRGRCPLILQQGARRGREEVARARGAARKCERGGHVSGLQQCAKGAAAVLECRKQGALIFDELCVALRALKSPELDVRAAAVFSLYDADTSGALSRQVPSDCL